MTGIDHYRSLVEPIFASRRWLIAAEAAAGATKTVTRLHEIGAPRPLILAGIAGTGEMPDPELAEVVVLGAEGTTMMEGIRASERAIRDLPKWASDRIEAWDPRREATVMTSGLFPEMPVLGRPCYGGRPREWVALEDKTTVDALWDEAGVPRAPSRVVPTGRVELESAAAEMDAGSGTVWVGDNLEGWHGGAEYLFVVDDASSAAEATEFLTSHCGRARVMPYLEGIPCSIHGMVFPDRVIAFRPAEMLIFRMPGSARLRYAGVATWWEPVLTDREEMRAAARRLGALLRDEIGYRGAFGIDGVLTADGFRPTEANTRMTVGLGLQTVGPDAAIPMSDLNRTIVAGEELDYRPDDLEKLVIDIAESNPRLRSLTPISGEFESTIEIDVEVSDDEVRPAAGAGAHGTLAVGPAAHGGIVIFEVEPGHDRREISAAPTAAAAFRLADELWDTGIGPLIPARPAR